MTIFGFFEIQSRYVNPFQDLAAKIKTIGLISKKMKKVCKYLVIMYL